MWLCCSLLVLPVITIIIANDVFLSVSPTFPDAHLAGFTQPTHSVNKKTKLYMFSWSEYGVTTESVFYSAGYSRNVGERGRREAKRFMKLPLKVSVGFRLRLHCCEDLRLISFRCCLAWVWLWEGTHIFAVITDASVGFAWKNRTAFVPTFWLTSCGCLHQLTDNMQPVLIQMEN